MPITRDELLQALQSLPPEQLANLITDNHGRSPFRDRQLTDLSLKPSARDPRPTFFAETDGREFQPITQKPYPKLLWHSETGQEITVATEQEHTGRGAVWTTTPPVMAPLTPEERARKLFESLNPADQAIIIEHQHQVKLDAVKQALEGLGESQIAALLAQVVPAAPASNGKR